jgi:serine/threonine protein kinase/pSer/pThr/pTyr-binding forkhead associated (FHA) protein
MNGDSINRAPSEAILKVKINGETRRYVLIADELVTIGRASTCGIQVKDKSVSREHCVAVFTDGKVCINDLRSTHGVTFQSERVGHCELRPGDSCLLGNVTAVFEPSGPAQEVRIVGHSAPTIASAPMQLASAKPAAGQPAAAEQQPTPEVRQPQATPAAYSPPANDAATPGREIAGYRILEKIGEGGFGTVYRAEQTQLHRQVALKVLKQDESNEDQDERIAAFLREARLAAGLRDPRLVQIYDVGESDGEHFLSMELIDGGSLARKLRRDGPMPWRDVVRLLRDIGFALKAAHAAQLVHRDVKPGNILLTASGQAKLTDLGLAATGSHAGTIAFMAPEQLRREAVDARADIYALGCTAYAALTGSPPFAGDKQEMARAQLKQKPAPLLDRDIQVPYHLNQLIVESMMAKDANDRPQSASELIERLDRLVLPSNIAPVAREEDDADYPSVAPIRLGRSSRSGSSNSNSQKAFLARLTGDAIIFTIVGGTVIALLLVLKAVWPEADIYRLIGK